MIDRVDKRIDISYPSYGRDGRRGNNRDEKAPTFLLGDDDKGVVWERGDVSGGKQQKPQKTESKTLADSRSVRRAPAVNSKPEVRKEQEETKVTKPAAAEKAEDTFSLAELWEQIKAGIKGFLQKLWNGEEEEKTQQSEIKPEKAATDIPEIKGDYPAEKQRAQTEDYRGTRQGEYDDARIRKLLADKDQEGFFEAITEGYTRKPARNTSLITHYDRFGRIVMPDKVSAARILHGDGMFGQALISRPQGNYRKYL